MRKRMLSLLLVLIMVLGMLPTTALADAADAESPFLSVEVNGVAVNPDAVEYKGIYKLDGTGSMYDGVVYEVPYYHITVPSGTETADVVFGADADLFYYESDGSLYGCGYKVGMGEQEDPLVDAVSSATVKNATVKDLISIRDSGEKVISLPVETYCIKEDSMYYGFTPENASFEAVCLFTFEYAETSTPEEPAGTVVPDGAPFTALTTDAVGTVTIADNGTVDYTGYNTYRDVPWYHVTIPAGATTVYVTHPASEDPFADASYGSAYGYYAETTGWTGDGMSYSYEDVEGGYTITLPLSAETMDWITNETIELSFVGENGSASYAVGVERNDYSPICFFTFEYAASQGGDTHEHIWDKGEVTTDPTCEEPGVRTFTCTVGSCGETKTEEEPATGHSWDDGEVTTDPTCEGLGEKTFTCNNGCGETKTEDISANGHSWDEGEVTTDPTCEERGVRTFTCTVDNCGKTKTEDIPATGHNFGTDKKCTNENCNKVDYTPEQDTNGAYLISNSNELLWFAEAVNSGQTTISGKLTADIDMSGQAWSGIGTSSNRFAGTFDGGGKTVTFQDASYGLFDYVKGASNTNRAEIGNVTIAGSVKAAAVAQIAQYANFESCFNKAAVTLTGEAAGILGKAPSIAWNDYGAYISIANCGNEGTINGKNAGGILGSSQSAGAVAITGCYNTGAITGSQTAGGIAGYFQGAKGSSMTNCYNRGAVSGDIAGGLVGYQYNGTAISNCYNTGESYYAISGRVYNNAASVSNTYYLASKSTLATPSTYKDGGTVTTVSAEGKDTAYMTGTELPGQLGEVFQQSCPAPVFTWQTAAQHTGMNDGICDVCGLGEQLTFDVTFTNVGGATFTGEDTVLQGENYTFTVALDLEKYEKLDTFAVTVNNVPVEAGADGTYTAENVQGNLIISVIGLSKYPDTYTVTLPAEGYGHRVVPEAGYTTAVPRKGDFKFKVNFVENFRAGEDLSVMTNGKELAPDANGVYTIPNVTAAQTITVEGTEMIPCDTSVKVKFNITHGVDKIYQTDPSDGSGKIMAALELDVPYFDLALYDLEKYYYNPYCYLDEDGNQKAQTAGTPETAYGNVTVMHAYIYATEVHYLGYDEADAGKGFADAAAKEIFQKAVSWDGDVGSSFMNLWDFGTNLNYYLNYHYPLGRAGWGSTSDQIALKDGDSIAIHMIENGTVSGSAFEFFVVNNADADYDLGQDQVDTATVEQGEEITLTLFTAVPDGNYTTGYSRLQGEDLYWIEDASLNTQIKTWNRTAFANLDAAYKTGADGTFTIDTAELEPGIYYLASLGGLLAGGTVDNAGFVSKGSETSPALLRLEVTEPETFTITLPEGEGYTVTGDASVTKGQDYTFTVTVEDGYKAGENFTVTANGAALTADETGAYTIENVTSDLTIAVSGVEMDEEPAKKLYSVVVHGGAVLNDYDGDIKVGMSDVREFEEGTKVWIKAAIKPGHTFDKWVVLSENVKLQSEKSATTSFTMPAEGVTLIAEYKENPFTAVTTTVPAAGHFTDVKASDWYYEAVQYVSEKGLMNGVTGTKFGPAMTTTRGMIVTILYRLEGAPKVAGKCAFSDVKAGSYYENAIIWANKNGIVNGYGETFGPNDAITREQLAAILYRYANHKDHDTSNRASLRGFSDGAQVSDYAVDAMEWAVAEGLINGRNGAVASSDHAIRAEAAAILMRFLEN